MDGKASIDGGCVGFLLVKQTHSEEELFGKMLNVLVNH